MTGDLISSADLDGVAKLRGGETGFTFLGLISSSKTHPDSVCNPLGSYGSPISEVSVRNPNGECGYPTAGSPYDLHFNSQYSSRNDGATTPPVITVDDAIVAFLSVRTDLTGAVHPDSLYFHLGCSY